MAVKVIHAFRKTPDTFAAGATTLPQKYFVSPEVFADEQEKIFSREWILVGHQTDVSNAGDFVVVEVAGESLIIARDKNDAIRAFYNVCRHRGTRLCEEQSGHAARCGRSPEGADLTMRSADSNGIDDVIISAYMP